MCQHYTSSWKLDCFCLNCCGLPHWEIQNENICGCHRIWGLRQTNTWTNVCGGTWELGRPNRTNQENIGASASATLINLIQCENPCGSLTVHMFYDLCVLNVMPHPNSKENKKKNEPDVNSKTIIKRFWKPKHPQHTQTQFVYAFQNKHTIPQNLGPATGPSKIPRGTLAWVPMATIVT